MSEALIRPVGSIMWELRAAWATGKRVSLSLDERCTPRRIEGHVASVASTGASVTVAGLHVPDDAILAVHLPSMLADSDYEKGQQWHGRGHRVDHPGQLVIEELAA